MKLHTVLLMLLLSPAAWAGGLEDCKQDATSANCSAYLNGVVDSGPAAGGQAGQGALWRDLLRAGAEQPGWRDGKAFQQALLR